jgi:hypothetical protein
MPPFRFPIPFIEKRRKARAGFSENFVTHLLHGSGSIGVTPLVTDDIFPDRSLPIMFQTRIRILTGVSQGLIFEFGSSTRGAAAWVEPNMIGIVAGNGGVSNERASAVWDLGAALATSRIFQLTFVIVPGSGKVRVWDFGIRQANGVAVDNDFGPGDWADTENGSFASALVGTVMADVPVGSRIAPSNFEVIEPLTVFNNQTPKNFF